MLLLSVAAASVISSCCACHKPEISYLDVRVANGIDSQGHHEMVFSVLINDWAQCKPEKRKEILSEISGIFLKKPCEDIKYEFSMDAVKWQMKLTCFDPIITEL